MLASSHVILLRRWLLNDLLFNHNLHRLLDRLFNHRLHELDVAQVKDVLHSDVVRLSLVAERVVHDKTELALALFALVASFKKRLFLLRIYFLTQLTSHVSLVFGFLGLDIELCESTSVDDLS